MRQVLIRFRWQALALAVFLLLTAVHTWPMASNPAHWSRTDNGDGLLNMWAVAWVGHQLPRDPLHLFNANIFYPEPLTLAYSEAMIVQGVFAMPVIAAGGSAVLAYNVALFAGFALTGWAFCLLIHRWTGSWGAAYTAGSLAAFNSHVLVRLAHLQAQHVEFVAGMLFALDRLVVSRRVRDAVWLGVAFALEGLTSVYLLVFSVWMLVFAVSARVWAWLRRNPLEMCGRLFIAGGTGAALLAPYLIGYLQLHRTTGFERSIEDNAAMAGSWVDYLSTGSRIHYDLWSYRFFGSAMSAGFPGIGALVLVVLAFTWPETRRDARLRMCAVAGAGCAVVSMLPRTPIFPLLYRVIPLFRAVRVEAHLVQLVLLMVAVIAGFGVAGLDRRWKHRGTWPVVAVAIVAVVNIEALRAPLELRFFDGIPPIYDTLARERGAVVVELPFYAPADFFGSAMYMLNSTRHWRPILNGYSGFRPASYDETYDAIRHFPDVASLLALHDRGVTHIVLHTQEVNGDLREAAGRSPSLSLIAAGNDIEIFRLK